MYKEFSEFTNNGLWVYYVNNLIKVGGTGYFLHISTRFIWHNKVYYYMILLYDMVYYWKESKRTPLNICAYYFLLFAINKNVFLRLFYATSLHDGADHGSPQVPISLLSVNQYYLFGKIRDRFPVAFSMVL